MTDIFLAIGARLMLMGARLFAWLVARLPRHVLSTGFKAAEWLVRTFAPKHDALQSLADVRDVIDNDPAGREALCRLLSECRNEQALSFFRGMLRHHVLGIRATPTVQQSTVRHVRGGRDDSIRLGILGSGFDVQMLQQEYGRREDCRVVALEDRAIDAGDERLAALNALEIANPDWANEEFLTAALSRGIALSVHQRCLSSQVVAERVCNTARQHGTPFRLFAPVLSYPPVLALKSLLDDNTIGEIATLRVRATIGGSGGTLPPDLPDREGYLAHPAFDHLLLLAYLGGAMSSVEAYLNPMERELGGQGLVACQFAHPGRYGLLECVFAPHLFIRSDYFPYDLEVEIAGTDGIIWLRRGMAKRTQSPAIEVRVGQQAFSFGAASGIEEDWNWAYREAAARFLEMVSGAGRDRMPDTALISALKIRTGFCREPLLT